MKKELNLEKQRKSWFIQVFRILIGKIFLVQIAIFFIAWSVTFFTLRNLRALKGIPAECYPILSTELPVILDGFIYYGLWAAFFSSFIYSFMQGFNSFKRSFLEYVITLILFSSYAVILELLFPSITSSYINWAVIDIVFFLVTIPIGNFFGCLFSAGFDFFCENRGE